MADRYLLESGAPDGYLVEDGTGVLLLEDAVAATHAHAKVNQPPLKSKLRTLAGGG